MGFFCVITFFTPYRSMSNTNSGSPSMQVLQTMFNQLFNNSNFMFVVEEIHIEEMFNFSDTSPAESKPKGTNIKNLGSYRKIKADDNLIISEETCSICMEKYKEKEFKRILPDCGHTFHKRCCDRWLKTHGTCPMCRKEYD